MLCLDTTLLRKFENENKKQNKKNLRLKIYGKIRNGRLKLEPSVLIKKKTCTTSFLVRFSSNFLLGISLNYFLLFIAVNEVKNKHSQISRSSNSSTCQRVQGPARALLTNRGVMRIFIGPENAASGVHNAITWPYFTCCFFCKI